MEMFVFMDRQAASLVSVSGFHLGNFHLFNGNCLKMETLLHVCYPTLSFVEVLEQTARVILEKPARLDLVDCFFWGLFNDLNITVIIRRIL